MTASSPATPVKAYAIALLTAAGALLLTTLTWPLFQPNLFPLFLAFVMLIAWYCGRVPGLLVAAVFGLGSHVMVRVLGGVDAVPAESAAVVWLLTFALAAVLISSLTAARRRAEAAEHQQREWFEGTLSSIGEAVIATDLSGRVRFLNPIAQALTGWSPSEAFGKPLTEVYQAVDEESRKPNVAAVMKVLQTGVASRPAANSLLVARDGSERPVDHSASPLRNTRGSIVGMVLVSRDATERKQAERKITELSASLSRRVKVLQTILDVSPMGIAVAEDADCQRIWYNPALKKMLRLPEDGETPATVSHAEAAYRIRRDGRELSADQSPMHVCTSVGVAVRDTELDFILPDGTKYTVLNNVEPLFDDSGKVRGCLSFCVDITDRKRAEVALRESEHFYRMLGEVVPDFIWTCDASGRPDFVNRRWQEYTGINTDECQRLGWDGLVHPDDRTAYQERWSESLHTGRAFEMEFRFRRSDGVYRCFMARAVPLRDAQGLVTKWVGTSTDIDDRTRAEEARMRLAAIVESSDDAIVSTTLDGIVMSWNRGAQRVFGYTPDEMLGHPISALVVPGHPDDLAPIHDRIRHGEAVTHYETVRRRKDGQVIDISLTVSPLRDVAGRVVGVSKIARDITERKRVNTQLREAKEAAEAANQAKDRFLAVLSHELRTPLTPVLLTVSSLLTEEPASSGLRPTLEMIRRNVELEARLIDDLLDVMRIVRGKMPFNPEVVDAHALIRQTVEICRSDILSAELELTLDLAAEAHYVHADPARLQQVFWNLVKNAVKFTPSGGSLTVRSREKPPADPAKPRAKLVVEFIDTGIGIDPEFLPKIFDAFEQGESSSWLRKHGGLGLGLAISQSVVQAQGGTLNAWSAGRNHGSTFTLELDTVAAPARPPTVPAPAAAHASPPRSLRILLVEDDPATLHAMAKLLGRLRYQVTTAASVQSALKAAEENEFDLVISDLGLPDGNGLELMRELRARRSLKGIALSGFGMDEDIRKSREAGFLEHLTKPINFQTLEATIQSVSAKAD